MGSSQAFRNGIAKGRFRMSPLHNAERKAGPEISFTHANAVERVHHELFKKALENPDKFPVRDYYICNACGHIVAGKPKAKCPVCGAVKKSFHKVD